MGREGHCGWWEEDVVDNGGQPHLGIDAQHAEVGTQPRHELEVVGGHILGVGGTDILVADSGVEIACEVLLRMNCGMSSS